MRKAHWNIVVMLLCGSGSARSEDAPARNAREWDLAAPPESDAFMSAVQLGPIVERKSSLSFPEMFGSLPGGGGTKQIPGAAGLYAYAPANRHSGGVRAGENESPAPQDRVYYSFTSFNRVHESSNPGLEPTTIRRSIIGIEKALFRGWASIGIRLPFVDVDGPPVFDAGGFADMSVVVKSALWRDRETGNVVSTGLAIAIPTGANEFVHNPGSGNNHLLRDALLQPFVAIAWSPAGRIFVQGFSSLVVPTDTRDSVRAWNDIAMGIWAYRGDGRVRAVAATSELHVSTPLSRRGKESTPIGYWDTVTMNWGGHCLFRRGSIGGVVGVPLTGPRPFGVEAAGRVTWNY